MIYEYECDKCGVVECEFDIGQAPSEVKCKCGKKISRHYGSMNFILMGGGWPGKRIARDNEQTKLNNKAGSRMRKEHNGSQPKLVNQQ